MSLSRQLVIVYVAAVLLAVSLVLFVAPADTASQPLVTLKPTASPSSYHLDVPADVAYTDTTYRVNWAGPAADRISLYYVINGKEYFVINVVGTSSYTYWRPPNSPDPSNLRDSVFHNVRLKAVWQTRLSGGGYKNLSTQTSDYFTIARPGQFVIREQSLPPAYVGQAYSVDLHAENGVTPYRWSVTSGSFPGGLTMNTNGQIRGTPAAAGFRTVKVHAADNGVDVATDDMVYTLYVLEQAGQPTPVPEAFDFDLEYLVDTTLQRPAGGYNTVTVYVNVRRVAGTAETVAFELAGCPTEGVEYAFSPRDGLPNPVVACKLNITASNAARPGVYDLTVRVRSTSGVEHSDTFKLNITDVGASGDLELRRAYWFGDMSKRTVMPVQVLDNMYWLVKGKNTIFHATVKSTFDTDQNVFVELWLPTEDWYWEGQPTDVARDLATATGTYTFPRHYQYGKWVTVPANGEVELTWPDPAGFETGVFHTSPYRQYDEYEVVTNAPKPVYSSVDNPSRAPKYAFVIDQANRVAEEDELNNYPKDGYENVTTVDSRRLNVLFTPFLSDNYSIDDYWAGGAAGASFTRDFEDNMTIEARISMEFMLGVYPIADEGMLSYYLNPGLLVFHPRGTTPRTDQVYYQEDLADMAAENGYDRVVALVPRGWYNSSHWGGVVFNYNPRACFVRINRDYYAVVTHENYHNLGYPDIDSTDNNQVFPAEDGYWVNEGTVKDVARDDVRDYMDYTGQPRWTVKEEYENVLNGIPVSDDPPVLLFRCLLEKNGNVTVKPFMIFDGWPDVEPAQWTHEIVLKDSGSNVVRAQKVFVSFTASYDILDDAAAPCIETTVDEAFISATVPWSDNVALIELRDRAGTLIAERKVSAHTPTVDITEPAPGTVWNYGGTYAVRWTGSDVDGDPLNYSLSVSTDKTNWLPVAIDIPSGEYLFNTATVKAGSYYFRVRVTDGVLSATDVMDQSFEVRVTGPVSTAMPPAIPNQSSTATPGSAPESGASPSWNSMSVLMLGGGLVALIIVGVIILGLRGKN
jgi:hypothetical protein